METALNQHLEPMTPGRENGLVRRMFLRMSAALILGGVAILCKTFVDFLGWTVPSPGQAPFSIKKPDKFPLFAHGTWIARDEGGLFAFSGTCPHLGCLPVWVEDLRQFHCPCHKSVFTADGSRVSGPAPQGLEHVLLKQATNDALFVDPSRAVPKDQRIPFQS